MAAIRGRKDGSEASKGGGSFRSCEGLQCCAEEVALGPVARTEPT